MDVTGGLAHVRRTAAAPLFLICVAFALFGCSGGDGDQGTGGFGGGTSAFYRVDVGLIVSATGNLGFARASLVWTGAESDSYAFLPSDCAGQIANTITAFNRPFDEEDDDPVVLHNPTIDITLVTDGALPVGIPLASCMVLASQPPDPSEFSVLVREASDTLSRPLAELPQLTVLGVTRHHNDGTGLGEETPSEFLNLYDIVFRVERSPYPIGALQIDVATRLGAGGFLGNGSSVMCDSSVGENALVAFNKINGTLRYGMITHEGIVAPNDLFRCRFRGRAGVSPADFLISLNDFSDTNSQRIIPPPLVRVSEIRSLN